ncbi:MAG: IS4 family transposase, partial [Flavobacterium sp.]
LDFDGNLPAYINITDGKTADNKGAYDIPLLKGSVIVADRFYNDFSLLNIWDSRQLHFVIRHKDNLRFEMIKELELLENRHQHVLKDEIIILTNTRSSQVYSSKLWRVAVWDTENEQVIELITNQFTWTANTISELYKSRWMVEIFFRDLKQLLHKKSFVGTSENAVMIQIWTALITILIIKALRAQVKFGWHLSNLVAFIRLNLFVEIELEKWLNNPLNEVEKPSPKLQQGGLF